MTYHASHDDPMPNYPKHCPECGEVVYPLHWSHDLTIQGVPIDEMLWHWTARCWNGHLVEALPAQLSLLEMTA